MNVEIAKKVLATVDAGLSMGLGDPVPGEMCVEAAVCFAMGEEHGDEPSCVSLALRRFKIGLNDSFWSSKKSRSKGMRRLALIQLGSKDHMDDIKFVQELAKLAKNWAYAAADAAAYAAAAYAARAARAAAAYAAADAADAADDANTARAARAAADAAAYAAAYAADAADADAAAYAARDKVLSQCAEDVVQLLIKMNVPGKQWLYLTEEN